MTDARIQTVTIVGVGLIGGSFALGLRRQGFPGRILGVSSPRTLEEAKSLGVIDEGLPLEQGVAQADLVYLAQPIRVILQQLPEVARCLRPGALVTDAGSTKGVIVAEAAKHFPAGRFLGGHPMAGKETRGVKGADAELFRERPYILTPVGGNESFDAITRELLDWVRKLGARLIFLDATIHDERVALISHLPQLCSTALASMLNRDPSSASLASLSGPGLLDMTRLALSSHDIWKDILDTNRSLIGVALDAYGKALQQVAADLKAGETEAAFSGAAKFARLVRKID